jgi:hypothetical protein
MGTRHIRSAAAQAPDARGWTTHLQEIDTSQRLLASVVPERDHVAERAAGVAHRLHGIGYDARADAIAIDVGELAADTTFLRYFIAAPRSIEIEKLPDVTTIVVVDARGERTHIYVYPES